MLGALSMSVCLCVMGGLASLDIQGSRRYKTTTTARYAERHLFPTRSPMSGLRLGQCKPKAVQ